MNLLSIYMIFVPIDLPPPKEYVPFDQLPIYESIWVKVGKRLKERRLARARNNKERLQAEKLGRMQSEQFQEMWCVILFIIIII